jgi:hypothetical protein
VFVCTHTCIYIVRRLYETDDRKARVVCLDDTGMLQHKNNVDSIAFDSKPEFRSVILNSYVMVYHVSIKVQPESFTAVDTFSVTLVYVRQHVQFLL